MTCARITAVSYLNTIPFVYGIEHAKSDLCVELLLAVPALCVNNFVSDKADVALVPVGALNELQDYEIVTSFCLAAESEVCTVELLSNSPLHEIDKIYLDSHSRTSNELVKILSAELWGIEPQWSLFTDNDQIDTSTKGVAYLMIGDKVFDHVDKFTYKKDLATEWRKLTGLPFVFAVWVARRSADKVMVSKVNDMLEYGVANIERAAKEDGGKQCYNEKVKYLTENIKFNLDTDKRKALEMFLHMLPSSSTKGAVDH